MLAEDLRVEMHADWSRVEAEIVLENQGPATTLQVALPQVVTPRVSSYSPMRKKTGLWDVALQLDGVSEPCTEVTGKFDHSDREATYFWVAPKKFIKLPVALGEHNVFPNAKLKWLSWELKFEPGQKRRVRIAYSLENGSYGGEVGASRLRYLLTTAGLWHGGKIERLTMRVTFDEAFSLAHLQKERAGLGRGYLEKRDGRVFYSRFDVEEVSPAEFKVEDASLVWEASPFIPKENLEIQALAHAAITCSSVLDYTLEYGPQQAFDGDTKTAWVPQGGTGGWLEIPTLFPRPFVEYDRQNRHQVGTPLKGIKLFAGYGKSPDLFQANSRPRTIEIGRTPDFRGEKFRVVLEDKDGWQEVRFPDNLKFTRQYQTYEHRGLYLRIIDVYPGSRYDDTCISEIELID